MSRLLSANRNTKFYRNKHTINIEQKQSKTLTVDIVHVLKKCKINKIRNFKGNEYLGMAGSWTHYVLHLPVEQYNVN